MFKTLTSVEPGDFVKFEVTRAQHDESEWMWMRVERNDEPNRVIFGWLDSQPIVFASELKLGQHMAVSYDNVREHRKVDTF